MSDSDRQVTAQASESESDSTSRRTRKTGLTTFTRGALVEEKEEMEIPLLRPIGRSKQIQMYKPTIQLDSKGSKLKYFVASSTGTIPLGLPLPQDENLRPKPNHALLRPIKIHYFRTS